MTTVRQYPLSFNQSTLLVREWLRHLRREPVLPRALTLAQYLDGDVDRSALQAALDVVVERHEILRTALPDPRRFTSAQEHAIVAALARDDLSGGDVFVQRVIVGASVALQTETVTDERALRSRVRQLIEAPFDYDAPPLMRAVLFALAPDRYLILLVLHHLVADSWSLGVLANEIAQAYAASTIGMEPALPRVELQYGDFAAAQRRRFSGAALDGAIRYWREQWRAFGDCVVRPADLSLAAADGSASAESRWTDVPIDSGTAAALRRLARSHRATTYMVCVAAMAIVCHGYTARRRLAWWGYGANRGSTDAEGAIGWFAHGRILGIDVMPDDDMAAVLARVRTLLEGIGAYEEVPLQLAWRAGDRARAAHADADGFLAFNILPQRTTVAPFGASVTARSAPPELTVTDASTSLTIWAFENEGELARLGCGYCTAWFDPSKVDAFLRAFARVLTVVSEHPLMRVSALTSAGGGVPV